MLDGLIEGVNRFQRDTFPAQRAAYERLAREGQAPKVLVISCSDSRAVPELFTASGPGDIFVTRNAGNVVPPHRDGEDGEAEGVASAIEFAILALGVSSVVVCGHTGCGAMKGLLAPASLDALPKVKGWLRHCRCAVEAAAADTGAADPVLAMVEANVVAQLDNLRTHPAVRAGLDAGRLGIHGWVFDIERGTVTAMDPATGRFQPLAEPAAAGRDAGGAVA